MNVMCENACSRAYTVSVIFVYDLQQNTWLRKTSEMWMSHVSYHWTKLYHVGHCESHRNLPSTLHVVADIDGNNGAYTRALTWLKPLRGSIHSGSIRYRFTPRSLSIVYTNLLLTSAMPHTVCDRQAENGDLVRLKKRCNVIHLPFLQ